VSFFTSQSATKNKGILNGIMYGVFIFLIYTLASLPFHLLTRLDPEIFNVFATNIWVNLLFFFIFIVFALSFFGLFEITLPSWLGNATDSKSNLGSAGGIFFMALTLALVSFSCTGPILGTLLVSSLSSGSGAWMLTAGMAGFGLALALPFALFAMFPGWMQKLPKSGGWLDTVKKVLAFVELAMAFKFLSNADLVAHWGILKREVFIGVWAAIALAASLYLFGMFRLPHDTQSLRISKGRIVSGIIVLLLAFYLLPGVTNTTYANLKLLSGFPPPSSYSVYQQKLNGSHVEAQVINDYDKALQLAKAQHKPLLIDFTGWACVNCRKMEENIWPKPEISTTIKAHFILVSLYLDDRKVLTASAQFTYKSTHGDKEIITNGDKWATFEAINFGQVTQPLYVILSPDEKLMNNPVGYTPDETAYLKWLQCGMDAVKAN
jgi:thiol:disulfide interchange protein